MTRTSRAQTRASRSGGRIGSASPSVPMVGLTFDIPLSSRCNLYWRLHVFCDNGVNRYPAKTNQFRIRRLVHHECGSVQTVTCYRHTQPQTDHLGSSEGSTCANPQFGLEATWRRLGLGGGWGLIPGNVLSFGSYCALHCGRTNWRVHGVILDV